MFVSNKSLVGLEQHEINFVLNIPLTADKTWLINKNMDWTHTSTELPCGENRTNCWYATVLLKRVFQLLSRPLVGG